MSPRPRVVFGMPAYNRPDRLAQTLESLLSQTRDDFALVIVDDRPTPEVKAIVDTYAALHPRITHEPNPIRLGMVGNWRKAFERSRALYPDSEYFAWVSDHDVWHPRWLEMLTATLDADPRVVLAYPQVYRVYANNERRRISDVVDTAGMSSREERLVRAATGMTAGNAIYGLFRARALEQAGVFRGVLLPDRQLIVELSLFGEFKLVPELLWYREVAGAFSYKRQREMFFPGGAPLYTHLPPIVQHFGVLVWDLGIRGRGRPAFGRVAALRYAAVHLFHTTRRELFRDDSHWRGALRQLLSRRSAGAAA
jgi:glycosyltransferase involved in cell wall biosynthesis